MSSDVGELLSGIGTLSGGVGGVAAGLIGAWMGNKAKQQARNEVDNWNNKATGMLDDYENSQIKFASPGDLQKYQEMKNNFDSSDYIYDFDQFDNSKYDVNNYMNENKDRILADVGKGVQSTAAGAGLGHSSGTLNNIINAQTNKNEELYNNAYNRMNTERNFDYQQYQDYITNMQSKLNQQYQIDQNIMNNLKSDLQFDQTQQGENIQNRMNLGNSITQSKVNLV